MRTIGVRKDAMSMYRDRGLKRKIELVLFAALGVVVFVAFFAAGNVMRGKYHSGAEQIKDDARVLENASLTFDLSIGYEEIAEISGKNRKDIVVDVRDRVPEGLEYVDASVLESDKYRCGAEIVDGFGYDEETKILSFQVKMPSIDCGAIVRLYTWTPEMSTLNSVRQDFYNYSYLAVGNKSAIANYKHVFIGEPSAALYEVVYSYTDEVPEDAADLPREEYYAAGASVGLAAKMQIDGYDFNGWYIDGELPKDNSFVMPHSTVTPTGVYYKK